jgi:hypothetical protein
MAEIRSELMAPGQSYRVKYQLGAQVLTYEGEYIGREVTFEGDYLLFLRLPKGSHPLEIFLPNVRSVETLDEEEEVVGDSASD